MLAPLAPLAMLALATWPAAGPMLAPLAMLGCGLLAMRAGLANL